MTNYAIIFLTLIAFCGCNRSEVTSPPMAVGVTLAFSSGFQGDSLICKCDTTTFGECRAYSDSLFMTAGYQFIATEGMHRLTLILPLEHAQADTVFWVWRNLLITIEAHLDRKTMHITYQSYSSEQNQYNSSQPPNQRLKLTEPAVAFAPRERQKELK